MHMLYGLRDPKLGDKTAHVSMAAGLAMMESKLGDEAYFGGVPLLDIL